MDDELFSQFQKQVKKQIESLRPEDIHLVSTEEISTYYTLVVRPDSKTQEKIMRIIQILQEKDPTQYYYSQDNLHLTILGNLSISLNPKSMIASVKKVLTNYSLQFHLLGVGSNYLAGSVFAYPSSFSLDSLRRDLSCAIGDPGDDYTKHMYHFKYMGWINILRYLHKPSEEFLAFLRTIQKQEVGMFRPTKVLLYKNSSKVLNLDKAELIYTFSL